MTIMYIESFDHYNYNWMTTKLNSYASSTPANFTISPLAARTGPYGLRATATSNTLDWIGSQWISGGSSLVYCGFALRINARPSGSSVGNCIFGMNNYNGAYSNNSVRISCWLNNDGKINMNDGTSQVGTGTVALDVGKWYYIEVKAKAVTTTTCNAGDITIRADDGTGPVTICAINANNSTSSAAVFYNIIFGRHNSGLGTSSWPNGPVFDIDDFYMLDGNNTPYNTYLGNCRVDCLFPTGVGASSQWTPLSAGSNYLQVNDPVPDGNTSYVYDSTAGHRDSYQMSDLPVSPTTIYAVQAHAFAMKDTSGTNNVACSIYTPSTYADGSNFAIGPTNYQTMRSLSHTNPATGAVWDTAGVNSMEAGVKFVS